jgi:UDP-3-O-[3-hydroxymyristoyl] glucosamine N-acyltransferase
MPSYTLYDIAKHIGANVHGEEAAEIVGLNTLQDADPKELSFLANPSYRDFLTDTKAGAVIITVDDLEGYQGNALLMDNPYLGYALASSLFDRTPVLEPGIHPTSVIADSASVANTATIGPNVVIGEGVTIGESSIIGAGTVVGDNSILGSHCRIAANVTIYHGVSIGDNVIVHSSAVIGADGFGFAHNQRHWVKIHQLGGVVVGNRVEIGACTTIDRGALGDTVIEDGVILDNHVQIAHNVHVGENTAMAGCSGISGSTVVGKNCIFAGQSGVVGHVTICDGVQLTGGTIVTKSLDKPGSYSSGTAFSTSREWRKNAVRFNQLDDLAQRIKQLEKKL